MKRLGSLAALAGAGLALWLLWRDDPRAVLAALHAAAFGLILAASLHVFHMLSNARAWQILFPRANRPPFGSMFVLVWIRESVNSLLPVIRVGGDLAAFRLMLRRGVPLPHAAATLVADTQLTLISQLMFTMIGIGFLFHHGTSDTLQLAGDLALGVAVLAPLLVVFALVQHVNPFARIAHLLNRVLSGKLVGAESASGRVDEEIKAIWRRRWVVFRYLFFWQPLHASVASLEIWTALYFLGVRVPFIEAFVIDSLIQALSSAAFFVPGALGVQEGGFLLIGGALGLDPAICLALAGARRIRDLVNFVPGLVAWQVAETPQILDRFGFVARRRRRTGHSASGDYQN